MRSVALDVGKEKLVLCEVAGGTVRLRRTVKRMEDLEDVLGPGTPSARVAFEACRQGWWIHDKLLEWGHRPLMLDTTRIRQLGVGQHQRKNDPIDSEVMARAVESGFIRTAHVLSPARREIRHQLAARSALIETRTRYINMVRGFATAEGKVLASCSAENFVRHARNVAWSPSMLATVSPVLALTEQLEVTLGEVTERLHALCTKEPLVTQLATIPFVGLIAAATFVAVIDEATRFRNAHQVESYLGLVPGENTSNSAPRLGAITKAGNRWARTMLVQSAWLMIGRGSADDPLVIWARALQSRRNRFIAAVGLARRLAGVMWGMWKNGEIYKPSRLAASSSLGMREASAETTRTASALVAGSDDAARLLDAGRKLKSALTRVTRTSRRSKSTTTSSSKRTFKTSGGAR